MKTLLIGGSGFVGQHLYRYLTGAGHSVRIFDKRVPKEGSGVFGDVKDLELLTEAMRGSDLVFHLASNPDISKAATEPTIDFYEGTLLTQNVLEAMRISGVRRLVYFSGSGVYGENAAAVFGESHGPLLPISTYGASKLAGEALICSYCHMFGLNAVVFRPANIVGSGQTHGIGYDLLRKLRRDPLHLRVLGDGSQKKSYIHVGDVMDAIAAIVPQDCVGYDVLNVANDDAITVAQIVNMAVDVMGVSPSIEYAGGDRGWNGDVPVIRLDCKELKAYGWTALHTSAEAMRDALISIKQEL